MDTNKLRQLLLAFKEPRTEKEESQLALFFCQEYGPKLLAIAEAAEPVVTRYEKWLKDQKNPDGSARSTYVGDVPTENLIRKYRELFKREESLT